MGRRDHPVSIHVCNARALLTIVVHHRDAIDLLVDLGYLWTYLANRVRLLQDC